MNVKSLLLVIILTAPLSACNPDAYSNPETQKIVDDFFITYRNSPKEAIVTLLSKNRWITNDDANKLVGQLDELTTQIGKFQGQEQIRHNSFGKSILQYVYIAKYERQPLKFVFRFYKPNDTWEFQSFNYEVDLMTELNEAASSQD